MNFGRNIAEMRKKNGMSQENVAEKLGVSRQTISKWEMNETLPDICQSMELAKLYGVTVDELLDDTEADVKELQDAIDKVSDRTAEKVDWSQVWSRKYPVLASYRNEVDTEKYSVELRRQLEQLKKDHGYSETDAVLVLKDILAHEMRK